jgi:hypothetical protein
MPEIEPHHLDGIAALVAAQSTPLKKQKDEKDTAFVKRIVCAYLNAHNAGLFVFSDR